MRWDGKIWVRLSWAGKIGVRLSWVGEIGAGWGWNGMNGIRFSDDESQDEIDNLIQDIEHVIYRIGDNSDKGIQEISISSISVDEGLFSPYGLGEIEIIIDYILV